MTFTGAIPRSLVGRAAKPVAVEPVAILATRPGIVARNILILRSRASIFGESAQAAARVIRPS